MSKQNILSKADALFMALLRFLPDPPTRPPVIVEDWELDDLLPAHQISAITKGTKR